MNLDDPVEVRQQGHGWCSAAVSRITADGRVEVRGLGSLEDLRISAPAEWFEAKGSRHYLIIR